ncbi:MAG: hypothetical protein ABJB98_01055 [Actinomycetota bacterium]
MSDPYYPQPSAPRTFIRGIWRWRAPILTVIGVLLLIALVDDAKTTRLRTAPGPGAILGGHPPAADITLGSTTVDAAGFARTTVFVTNHSSKTSNYLIGLTMRSASGSTLRRTDATVKGLRSGTSMSKQAVWPGQTGRLPAGIVVVVTSVDRWAHI